MKLSSPKIIELESRVTQYTIDTLKFSLKNPTKKGGKRVYIPLCDPIIIRVYIKNVDDPMLNNNSRSLAQQEEFIIIVLLVFIFLPLIFLSKGNEGA